MPDRSHLDLKYFIDHAVYNCPFCNRRNVKYSLYDSGSFNWSNEKNCYFYVVKCSDCKGNSFHLSYEVLKDDYGDMKHGVDFDSKIFYSVPTSFFVVDKRIPVVIRELIIEAEGSLKMNFLTGASACMRKAIYELTVKEECLGDNYEAKIKFLKDKYPSIDAELFDVLAHIQDMTSDKVHEQSWPKWDSENLKLIIETLKAILVEIYVVPEERKDRFSAVKQMLKKITEDKSKTVTGKRTGSDGEG